MNIYLLMTKKEHAKSGPDRPLITLKDQGQHSVIKKFITVCELQLYHFSHPFEYIIRKDRKNTLGRVASLIAILY